MTEPTESSGDAERRERRRLAEVFGDVLPEVTSDERDPERGTGDADSWFVRNRPPHHDRD